MRRRVMIVLAAVGLVVAACGGGDTADERQTSTAPITSAVAAGDATRGLELYDASCTTCHGPGGEGIEGLGKPMPGSAFIAGLSDDGLITFIKSGRPTSDPENTTGVDMPPKGGNPALTDADLADLVAYIRTIN